MPVAGPEFDSEYGHGCCGGGSKSTSSTENVFKCDICERVFTTEQAMLNHKQRHKDHEEQKKHRCTLCPYSTKYSSHLKQHMFTHTGERPFKCTQCKSGFTQNSLLKKHMLIHKRKEEINEGLAEKQLPIESSKTIENVPLKERLLSFTHSSKKETRQFKCDKCSKKFEDKKKLFKHLKKHRREEKPHKCIQCNKRFSETLQLKKHEKQHVEEEMKRSTKEKTSIELTHSSSD